MEKRISIALAAAFLAGGLGTAAQAQTIVHEVTPSGEVIRSYPQGQYVAPYEPRGYTPYVQERPVVPPDVFIDMNRTVPSADTLPQWMRQQERYD